MKYFYLFFLVVFAAVVVYHWKHRSPAIHTEVLSNAYPENDAPPVQAVITPEVKPSRDSVALVIADRTTPDSLVTFAQTLLGTPYLYASTDPLKGFDCSGFITYVFSHFHIKVPRSSIDFTNVGKEIPRENAVKGDLILFTGTDSTERFVGHMGIVTYNSPDSLAFIHSSSGKANGVVVTPLNNYYKGRFVKVIRLF